MTSIYDEIVHGSVVSIGSDLYTMRAPTTVRSHPGAVQVATHTAEDQPDDGLAHSGPWFTVEAAEELVELLKGAIERAHRGEMTKVLRREEHAVLKAAGLDGLLDEDDDEDDESEEDRGRPPGEAQLRSPDLLLSDPPAPEYPDNWVVVDLPGGIRVAGLPDTVTKLAGFGKS